MKSDVFGVCVDESGSMNVVASSQLMWMFRLSFVFVCAYVLLNVTLLIVNAEGVPSTVI